mgnify:CR=1 FL=1
MLKRPFENLKSHFKKQARTIFRSERRRAVTKRQFLESMFREQDITQDRELAMTIMTHTIRRLYQLHKDCGMEELMKVLQNEN